MARKSASAGRGLSDDGGIWDEDFAPDAFAEFDFPRRRITGGRGRATNDNGLSTNGNGRSVNGNGRSVNGVHANGRNTNGNGRGANGTGRSANGNGRSHVSDDNGWFAAFAEPAPLTAREAASSQDQPADSGRAGQGIPGRRTVTIRGHGAERNLPSTARQSRRRPSQPAHQRPGFRADRFAMWAFLLGITLLVVAAASSHAAVLHAAAMRSVGRAHGAPAVTRSVAGASSRHTRGL